MIQINNLVLGIFQRCVFLSLVKTYKFEVLTQD